MLQSVLHSSLAMSQAVASQAVASQAVASQRCNGDVYGDSTRNQDSDIGGE